MLWVKALIQFDVLVPLKSKIHSIFLFTKFLAENCDQAVHCDDLVLCVKLFIFSTEKYATKKVISKPTIFIIGLTSVSLIIYFISSWSFTY